jgi:hypothetical protein
MSLTIRYGKIAEGATLVELQRRASLQWESDRAALLAHPEVIQLPASQLEEQRVRVAEIAGRLAGFSVVIPTTAICWELDGLFVEPELARDQNVRVIEVTANVNAKSFYKKLGFIRSGDIQTSFGPAIRMHLPIPR